MIKKIKKKIYNLLRWSQKYTKTDMVYLARGSFWLNVGQGISSIAGITLTIAFANLIPAETYGTFKFIISIATILSIPTLNGMNTALIKSVAQGNEGTLLPALKTKIKWGLLSSVTSLALSGYYYLNGNTSLTFSFLIAAFFLPFMDSLNIWTNYLSGKKKFKSLGKYQAIQITFKTSILIITLFFTNNLILIFFVHLISQTLIRLGFTYFTIKKFPPNDKYDPSSIGYGKHLSLMGILNVIATNIDKVLLFHFLGPINLAIYTFALRPVMEIKKPIGSLTSLSLPKLSQRSISELKLSLSGKIFKLFITLTPVVGAYILLAPIFYNSLFPNYTEAIIYSQIFSLSILTFPKMLIMQTLTAHTQKKFLYILKTLTPIFKISLFLILLPFCGIWGAIITLLLTELFEFILLTFILKKI